MKLIVLSLFIDIVLIAAIALCEPVRIKLFLILGALNILFYLALMLKFFLSTIHNEMRKGLSLEFVMVNSFFVAGLALFRMSGDMVMNLCQ